MTIVDITNDKDCAIIDAFDGVRWKWDENKEKAYFSDKVIVLKSIEDTERIEKFHVHQICISTGRCRIEKSLFTNDTKSYEMPMNDGVMDAFPFFLDHLYEDSNTPKQQKESVAILALARYFGVKILVKEYADFF